MVSTSPNHLPYKIEIRNLKSLSVSFRREILTSSCYGLEQDQDKGVNFQNHISGLIMERGLNDEGLDLDKLEDPGDRFQLQEIIGTGVNANVYRATDSQEGKLHVFVLFVVFWTKYLLNQR